MSVGKKHFCPIVNGFGYKLRRNPYWLHWLHTLSLCKKVNLVIQLQDSGVIWELLVYFILLLCRQNRTEQKKETFNELSMSIWLKIFIRMYTHMNR